MSYDDLCTPNKVREYVLQSGQTLHTFISRRIQGSRLQADRTCSVCAQYNYYCRAQPIIMVSISLQPESGYVFLVVAGTFILNMYQMLKVSIE